MGEELIERLAQELGKLPNDVLIEGHTDARPFCRTGQDYSNWELSTDRANAARRLMEETACGPVRSYRCADSPTRICAIRTSRRCVEPAYFGDRALSERGRLRRAGGGRSGR